MSAGRIILLTFGVIFVLVSLGLLIAGGVILGFEGAFRDSDGYYTVRDIPIEANSTALVTSPAEINIQPGWFWGRREPLTIRVEANSSIEAKPIFIGIARTADFNQYLGNANYDEVIDFSLRPDGINTRHHAGTASPAPPTAQDFWVTSASGAGTQRLQWDVAPGNYRLVLMNADATTPVYANASLGARIPPVIRTIGWVFVISGIVVLIIGGVMIFFAVRGW